jgi:hypothetical protein
MLAAVISMDAMPNPLDPSEFLGIDVDHTARVLVLVPRGRSFRLCDPPEPAETDLLENLGDGRRSHLELRGDLPGRLATTTELGDPADERGGRLERASMGPRRAILQA